MKRDRVLELAIQIRQWEREYPASKALSGIYLYLAEKLIEREDKAALEGLIEETVH